MGDMHEYGMIDKSVFAGMYISKKDFYDVVSEHMDMTDVDTINTVCAIDEADRAAVLTTLTSKLYDNIVEKSDQIDFGSIETSRGDITKIENYDKMIECVDVMRQILIEYKQDTKCIDDVIEAIDNIKSRKELWEKCYQLNLELPILEYQVMTMAVVASISLHIATCIEFIKSPDGTTYMIVLDKTALRKTQNNLLYRDLAKFNAMCRSGQVDEIIEHCIKMNAKSFVGGVGTVIGAGAAAVLLIKMVIPTLRELVYFFFHAGQSVSDYFAIQADLLEVNANNLMYNSKLTDDERNKIYGRQTNIVSKFRKVSDKFSVKLKKADMDSARDVNADSRRYKISDVADTKLDSDSSGGLF